MAFDIQKLDAMMAAYVAEKKLPGVAVAVNGPEGVIFEKGYGIADGETRRPLNEHTVMGIASMSKSTTTLALCILAAEGKFSFDDPVTKYFPSFRVPGNPPQDVTVHHLAMHTAGIPPMEPLSWSIAFNTPGRANSEWSKKMRSTAPNDMSTIDQVIDYIANCPYPTLGQAGEYMSYSNEGYAILSYIVDKAAGMPLEQFLKERVFGPMGMTRTVLDIDGSEARAMAGGNMTRLFEADGDTVTCDDNWSTLPPFRGCACVKSTAHDMARYYQCISNRGVIDGVQAIPAQAVELLVGAGFPLTEKPVYCYGLNKRSKNGHVLCEHSGGLHGVSSHGALLLDENYGFVALCNQGSSEVEPMVKMMYNMVMGLPMDDMSHWLKPSGEAFANPEMLVGKYICHEGTTSILEIYEEDGKLMGRNRFDTINLTYCGGTWFLTEGVKHKGRGRLHFFVRDGKAWAVQVTSRIYPRTED